MKNVRVRRANSKRHWRFDEPIKLVWTDPPFGTGKKQAQGENEFLDVNRREAMRLTTDAVWNMLDCMTSDGVICICADDRIIHHIVGMFENDLALFHQGDVIWTFGLGRPRTSWWPRRHNTIATFTMQPTLPAFDASAIPREIRKAPKAGYEGDKAAGSVWDYTMSNTDPERVGYPNQKPLAIIEPFILAHTVPGDIVADPFMGSGSVGVASLKNDRRFRGQDMNPKSVALVKERLWIK